MNLIELYDGWLENISFVPDIEVKTAQLQKKQWQNLSYS